MLKQDIDKTYRRIPGGKLKKILGAFRTPGVHAITVVRFGQWLKRTNIIVQIFLTPLYILLNHRMKSKWGIDIPWSTEIGEGFYIGHFGGITINGNAKIGKNVNISQGVTIGRSGQGEKAGVPTIGDNVYIGPGAKIFGKITIGNNVKIGANAVVYRDIPDNAVVALDPGFKIISNKGNIAVD